MGCDVRLITTYAADKPGNMVIGCDQGIYWGTNSGTSWQSINGKITSSILYSLGVSGSTILTTAQDFNPINTFNGGSSWSVATGPEGGEGGTVLFNPVNPSFVYHFTNQLQYSNDGGQTFNSVSTPTGFGSSGNVLAVDPNNASTVYAATSSGIYQSTDWGMTWALEPWTLSGPQLVYVSPANSQTIFVGSNNLMQCGAGESLLCFTTDGGNTWTPSNLGPAPCGWPQSIAIDPANPQVVLVGGSQSPSCGGPLRSLDGGATFFLVQLPFRQVQCWSAPPIPSLQLDPSSSGAVAAATPNGVYISTDFGLSWQSIHGNTVPLSTTGVTWSGGYLYESTCGEGVLRISFPF